MAQDSIIEAQIPAQQYRDMGFREGETLVVTPRRARVFVEGAGAAAQAGETYLDGLV
jgi:hypothetical protein